MTTDTENWFSAILRRVTGHALSLIFGMVVGGILVFSLSGECYSLGTFGLWGADEDCVSAASSVQKEITSKIDKLEHENEKLNDEIDNLKDALLGIEGHLFLFDITNNHRNRFPTNIKLKDYPLGMIMGWHLSCEPESDDRDIESIFLESKDGIWNLYLEHKSKCHEIEVMVGFVTKNLGFSHFDIRDRASPDGSEWPIREPKERFTKQDH